MKTIPKLHELMAESIMSKIFVTGMDINRVEFYREKERDYCKIVLNNHYREIVICYERSQLDVSGLEFI